MRCQRLVVSQEQEGRCQRLVVSLLLVPGCTVPPAGPWVYCPPAVPVGICTSCCPGGYRYFLLSWVYTVPPAVLGIYCPSCCPG